MAGNMMSREEGETENDMFDRLPDAILHLIFNKLHDAQSLTQSMSVCKRFASLIPEIDTVSLTIPRRISLKQQTYNDQITKSNCADCKHEGPKSLLKNLIRKVIATPIRFLLHRVFSSKSTRLENDCDGCFYLPNEVLKNFKEIQSLRIELPGHGGEIGSHGCDSLLRWRAEFGRELESCVIFGAKSLQRSSKTKNHNNGEKIAEQLPDEEFLMSDDDLKMRIVWTISSLIAASARHYLMQEVVSDHQMLQSAVISDMSKQGRMRMNREQIGDLRENVNSTAKLDFSPEMERTPVPSLKMKLWYVPDLELPAAGCVMKGATLLVITPVDRVKTERDSDLVSRVWKGDEVEEEEEEAVYGEAVREMVKKKKTYTLQMNSF